MACLMLSCQPSTPNIQKDLQHLDLLATGVEYREFIKKHGLTNFFESRGTHLNLDPIERAIKLGNRNLDWLVIVNKKRVKEGKHELSITNQENTLAYPINSPYKYSPHIIDEELQKLITKTPIEILTVLNADMPIPDFITVDEKTYVSFASEYDRLYESATRWKLIIPYLQKYKDRKKNDIRGFYFLMNQKDLSTKLQNFSKLDSENKTLFKTNLQGLCFNTINSFEECTDELEVSIAQNLVENYYLKYKNKSEQIYQNFFNIKNPRADIRWSKANPSFMTIPFLDPQDSKVLSFLKLNIEEAWKTKDWNLVLDFKSSADIHVVFKPDATPNVNGLGGNTITMNKNSPLTEWGTQLDIRHEFGHVLGFPDCYIEFYDEQEKAMMGYQLDTTNLMCSRVGQFKQLHYDELKEAYLK